MTSDWAVPLEMLRQMIREIRSHDLAKLAMALSALTTETILAASERTTADDDAEHEDRDERDGSRQWSPSERAGPGTSSLSRPHVMAPRHVHHPLKW